MGKDSKSGNIMWNVMFYDLWPTESSNSNTLPWQVILLCDKTHESCSQRLIIWNTYFLTVNSKAWNFASHKFRDAYITQIVPTSTGIRNAPKWVFDSVRGAEHPFMSSTFQKFYFCYHQKFLPATNWWWTIFKFSEFVASRNFWWQQKHNFGKVVSLESVFAPSNAIKSKKPVFQVANEIPVIW